MRARLTRELIAHRGFGFVAVEADWPDAARIDDYVLGGKRRSSHDFVPFERFPRWMWRNHEVHDFVDWLRAGPVAPGFESVLIAGDPERAARAQREVHGIVIDDQTWAELVAAGAKGGVPSASLWDPAADRRRE